MEDSMTSDTQIHNQPDAHSTDSATLQKMVAEQVQPDTFNPLCHKLRPNIEPKLGALLKEYTSQFANDEMSIGITLWSCIPETIPDCYEKLPMSERSNW